MLARHSALSLIAATCCFTSCATPRTSQGLIDLDGEGLAESVVVLDLEEDRDAVLIHLKKIEVSQKMLKLAEEAAARVKQYHLAGRMSTPDLLKSESRVASATIDLIDAKLALAQTGLLSATEKTFLDTDGDGLPDMLHAPIDVDGLLAEKVKLSRELLEQRSHAYERAKTLEESGIASPDAVRVAAQQMYEAEIDWLNARLQRESK